MLVLIDLFYFQCPLFIFRIILLLTNKRIIKLIHVMIGIEHINIKRSAVSKPNIRASSSILYKYHVTTDKISAFIQNAANILNHLLFVFLNKVTDINVENRNVIKVIMMFNYIAPPHILESLPMDSKFITTCIFFLFD